MDLSKNIVLIFKNNQWIQTPMAATHHKKSNFDITVACSQSNGVA
jgi:hypothetical protein